MRTKNDFTPPGKPGATQKTTLITNKPSETQENGIPNCRPKLAKKSGGSGLSDWMTSDIVKPC